MYAFVNLSFVEHVMCVIDDSIVLFVEHVMCVIDDSIVLFVEHVMCVIDDSIVLFVASHMRLSGFVYFCFFLHK